MEYGQYLCTIVHTCDSAYVDRPYTRNGYSQRQCLILHFLHNVSIHLPLNLSLNIYPSINLSISIHLHIYKYPSFYLSTFYISFHLSIYLSIHLSKFIFHLSLHLSPTLKECIYQLLPTPAARQLEANLFRNSAFIKSLNINDILEPYIQISGKPLFLTGLSIFFFSLHISICLSNIYQNISL